MLDPSFFSFPDDNDEDKSFFRVKNIIPWKEEEPNDDNTADEACVETRINGNESDIWVDVPCSKQNRVLCQQFIASNNLVESDLSFTKVISIEVIITVSFVIVCLIIIVQVVTFKLSKELIEKTKIEKLF